VLFIKNKTTIFFGPDEEIINPCWDNVFKAVFTKNTPESRGALSKLLSAILERDLTVKEIVANEPPVGGINERQIRYDINCGFEDGELCNIEMTFNPNKFEPLRLEYYEGKLHTSQNIRGKNKSFKDLKHSYQIALLVNSDECNSEIFLHNYEYYDIKNKVSLNGITHIITVEFAKTEHLLQKAVSEMASLERWIMFFRFSPDKTKRALVNEIIKAEEGISMGAQALLEVSRDRSEWARLNSEYKFAVDFQSNLVEAKREGRQEGRQEEKKEAAKRALKRGAAPQDVAYDQDLPIEEILKIKRDMA